MFLDYRLHRKRFARRLQLQPNCLPKIGLSLKSSSASLSSIEISITRRKNKLFIIYRCKRPAIKKFNYFTQITNHVFHFI